MSDPYLHALYLHATHGVKVMAQCGFKGLTEQEHCDLILASLSAVHDSLQKNMNEASGALDPRKRAEQLDQAAKILEGFKNDAGRCDDRIEAALDLIRFWYPEGGAK